MLDWRSERVQGAPKLVKRVQEERIIGRILLERRKHVVGIPKVSVIKESEHLRPTHLQQVMCAIMDTIRVCVTLWGVVKSRGSCESRFVGWSQ